MNHRFQRNNDTICWEWMTNWELVVILSNIQLSYDICYDHYYVVIYDSRVITGGLEVVQYLVSNNICTIYNDTVYGTNLIFNPHILLELC